VIDKRGREASPWSEVPLTGLISSDTSICPAPQAAVCATFVTSPNSAIDRIDLSGQRTVQAPNSGSSSALSVSLWSISLSSPVSTDHFAV